MIGKAIGSKEPRNLIERQNIFMSMEKFILSAVSNRHASNGGLTFYPLAADTKRRANNNQVFYLRQP